jgi:adenosylcobyric acid synthase
MHVGTTTGPGTVRPMLRFADGRPDGAMSADGRLRGCYVHGLFNGDRQRAALLRWTGAEASGLAFEASVDAVLDGLADHIGRHVDLDALLTIASPAS